MDAILDSRGHEVRVFLGANKFKAFAKAGGKVLPVIKPIGLYANPTVRVPLRRGRCVQGGRGLPRLYTRSLVAGSLSAGGAVHKNVP